MLNFRLQGKGNTTRSIGTFEIYCFGPVVLSLFRLLVVACFRFCLFPLSELQGKIWPRNDVVDKVWDNDVSLRTRKKTL